VAKLIHRHGDIRTIYDDDGHVVQFEEWGEKKMKSSTQTWPDYESAKKAFFDGSVILEPWIDYPNGTP
jgi:hypothetical protein